MRKIEDKNFFRTDTISLAQNLIGKWIETNIDGIKTIAQISETEAYLGVEDSACHTFGNKRTPRTEPMYQDGGTIYIYLCYGMHYLFNIVSSQVNTPEAVLIRACVQATGPAKLTKYLHIDKSLNNTHIIDNSSIAILDDGQQYTFTSEKRIGIDFAFEKDRNSPLRFVLNNKKA